MKGAAFGGEMSLADNSVLDASNIYEFDRVFQGGDQSEVYKEISSMVAHTQSGYNLTVFAYGQTGSGKTYTMEGTEKMPGVIPRTIEEVFETRPRRVCLSVVEIYNEKASDLLAGGRAVVVREDAAKVVVDGLVQKECATKKEALEVFRIGAAGRRTEDNGLNSKSSRSHMVLTISVERGIEDEVSVSKITLVDLAGSERIEGDTEDENRAKRQRTEKPLETANINKSLLYLSRIIYTLSSGDCGSVGSAQRARHVSYRDSKLTFILRDSLNGKSHLAIIGTVNAENRAETRNTVKFLATAKKIKLEPESMASQKTAEKLILQIKRLGGENIRLQGELDSLKEREKIEKRDREVRSFQVVDRAVGELEDLLGAAERVGRRAEDAMNMFESVKDGVNRLQTKIFTSIWTEREKEIDSILSDIENGGRGESKGGRDR